MINDFSSIERLMEFGMSMAVAQQMVATMNHAIDNMAVPGAGNPLQGPAPIQYYAAIDGAQTGPLNEDELHRLIEMGKITADTLVWYRDIPAWRRACEVPIANKWLLLSNPLK